LYTLGSDSVVFQGNGEHEQADSVIMTGFSESSTEQSVNDYFNKKDISGDDGVTHVVINKNEGWCTVSFSNPEGTFS
jgi:hypothetical protein